MDGKPDGRRRPLTQAQKDHLSQKRKDFLAQQKKEKEKPSSGNDPSANRGGSVPGGGKPSNDPGNHAGKPGPSDPHGPGNGPVSPGTKNRIGSKIPKKESVTEILVDQDKFLNGLPALVRLHVWAVRNFFKLFNLLPIPIKITFEDMTVEESQTVTEAIKPGLKQSLPDLGKKHPIGMMIYTGAVVLFAKLKVTLGFTPREPKPAAKEKPKEEGGGLGDGGQED